MVHSKHSVTENGVESSPSASVQSYTVDVTDSSNPEVETDSGFPLTQSPAGSEPCSSSGVVETTAAKSATDVDVGRAGSGTKQLIRMSADSVVTESTLRSGWFWSKKSTEHANKMNSASGTGTSTPTNVPAGAKAVRKSSRNHAEPSGRNEDHGMATADCKASLANSSVSGKGDTSGVSSPSSSDVENSIPASMHDHSRFSKHSSADHSVTSTPVRGNSSSGRHVESYPDRQITSSSSAARSQTDAVPGSPLSYAFVLPETSIRSSTATAAHTSSISSTQNETVSKTVSETVSKKVAITHNVLTVSSASRQSSSANAEFDEGRYEALLREKAGLEGRLEVMERENSEMLQQQAELKQRAAMSEQQIKTIMSTSQALNADRSAMAVDLETLRQNRSRLEAVIVDAHKLLEEKEQEVRTLERDLELARLAGEKHLEKVADIRREATSRDATVRDLKAKITELYVQSQTSDQSRQVLEGELAAVRADVTALTEAKEWYANQLRSTQKDRTRLQQEAAAARAETITANVASERLRAENARVKRNLAEVEQRVLTEKQTLARHLEDIEADMLAREAALTVQLRQANESSNHPTVAPSSHDESEELSHLKAELQRNGEKMEAVQRENVELSRRLALSQQCIIDRDETVKSLERDRETAELRAEATEQDVALRAADVQRLEADRSDLQLQLDCAGKERQVIDQSLQTLRRDTAVLETSFRRMQQDLAAKAAEVEKLSSLRMHGSEERLSEVWPDMEAAAGLTSSKGTPTSAGDASTLSKVTFADKEIQSDDVLDRVDGTLTLKFQDTTSMVTTDTQTDEATVAVITETAEKLLRVNDVVLQSELIRQSMETSETVTADVGSRIIEHPLRPISDNQTRLELELTEKSLVVEKLSEELRSIKESLSKTQAELDSANRHRHLLESEKLMERGKEDNVAMESLVLNTQEDLLRVSSISDSRDGTREVARVHKSGVDQSCDVELQTDEVDLQTDELRQQVGELEMQLTTLQEKLDAALNENRELQTARRAGELEASATAERLSEIEVLEMQLSTLQEKLDTALDENTELQTAKRAVELEAIATAQRLYEVEKLLQQTQDDLVGLERQLSEADSNSLEVHNSPVKRLEKEKLSLQSQLDELTQAHHKDVSRLKSKVCCCIYLLDSQLSNVNAKLMI